MSAKNKATARRREQKIDISTCPDDGPFFVPAQRLLQFEFVIVTGCGKTLYRQTVATAFLTAAQFGENKLVFRLTKGSGLEIDRL